MSKSKKRAGHVTHVIVTRAVKTERKRGHAAITKAPAKRRR